MPDDYQDSRLTRAERDIRDLTIEVRGYREEVAKWQLSMSNEYLPRREVTQWEQRIKSAETLTRWAVGLAVTAVAGALGAIVVAMATHGH